MMQPGKTKYRKAQKGRIHGNSSTATRLNYGTYGLKAIKAGRISARQIEAARRAMTRYAKRGGKIWIRVFPDKSVTARAAETRMGKGKGSVDHWVAVVKAGRIMFEMAGVPEEVAREAMRLAAAKLPIATKIVKKQGL